MNFIFCLFTCKLLHVYALCTFCIIYLHRLLSVIVVPLSTNKDINIAMFCLTLLDQGVIIE